MQHNKTKSLGKKLISFARKASRKSIVIATGDFLVQGLSQGMGQGKILQYLEGL